MADITSSIPALTTNIAKANVGQTGQVSWAGNLENINYSIVQLLRQRGLMYVSDIATLALMGGVDAEWVAVTGTGLYHYDPNGSNPPGNSVTANGGGVWTLEVAFNSTGIYQEVVGDGSSTTFVLQHNLFTTSPTVVVYSNLIAPYAADYAFSVQVLNPNSIQVTFEAPVSFNGRKITVKP